MGVCVVLEDDLCDSGADKSSRLLEDIVSKRECPLLLGVKRGESINRPLSMPALG